MYHSLKTLMLTVFLWSISHGVYSQSQTFDDRLAQIQSLDDKSQALLALKSLSPLDNEKQRFLVQKETFMSYWALNDLKKALNTAQEALTIAHQSNFAEEIGTTQKFIGIFHYYLGENEAALAAYEKSLQQFKVLEKPLEQANIYNNISLVYTTTGEIAQALNAIQLAEPLFQTYGSEVDKVDIRYTLAVLHLRLKRYDIAIEILLDVIDKRIAMNNDADLASAYADIGVAYKNARQLNNAEHYMNKAMDYYLGKKDFYQVASQYQNIADLYIIKREYDKAEKYALKAIEISQQVGHQKAYIASLYNLAICLLYRGNTEQAFEHISRSTELAKKINYNPAVTNNKAVLALTHASNQNMAEAIQYYHQFIFEKHRSISESLNRQLAQFEAKQLSQQVRSLEQSEKLNQLEKSQQQQKLRYGTSTTLVVVLLAFLLYRRHKYKQLKVALEAQVQARTLELEQANKKLSELSFLDGSTSTFNRRSFDFDIQAAWNDYIKKGHQFVLLIASIDQFNLFNDKYGYLAGDDALKAVAETIQAQLSEESKIYRFGGSEFAIIYQTDDIEQVKRQFTQILAKVADLKIEHASSLCKVLTLSAGVCDCQDNVHTVEQIIDKVDQRVYIAKKSGRNQLVHHVHKND